MSLENPELPATSACDPGLKLDCRRFRGDRPCAAGVPGPCPADCAHYAPTGRRILIIKLGALGDVIRTTALLPGLKTAWPSSQITWITRPAGVRMLSNNPQIDRLLPLDSDTLAHITSEFFDLCLSLDKEPAPAGLAMRVHAAERRGIGLSRWGTPLPLNPECREYFRLGLNDELKFRTNEKSYARLIYEAVGLPYAGQRHRLYPSPASRQRAAEIWSALGVHPRETIIGLNTGAGAAFANKTWVPEKFARLARVLVERHRWRVALLGGPDELDRNAQIERACRDWRVPVGRRTAPGVIDVCAGGGQRGAGLRELDFAAVLERCDVLVTGDTMALHVATAADVACVALFGPTCAQEIDLFERGTKLRTTLGCAPCYRRTCDRAPNCMDEITVEDVAAAVAQWAGGAAKLARVPTGVGAS